MAQETFVQRVRIVGTGSYTPACKVTNADIEKTVATSDAWIKDKLGIEERRIADPSRVNIYHRDRSSKKCS